MPSAEPPRTSFLLEVTRRCSRECAYCYAEARRVAAAGPSTDDLTPARVDALLERVLATTPVEAVTLIGGEPLVAPGLEALVQRLSARGLRVALCTNGLSLPRPRIEALVRAGVRSFEVSYDSPVPSSYAALTGSVPDGLQTTLAALVRTGVPVTVGALLTRHNADDVEALLRVCFALSVARVTLNQLAPVGGALRRRAELELGEPELRAVLARADAVAARLGLVVGVGLPVEPCRIAHDAYPHLRFDACWCGDRKWLLEPSGDVRVCELAASAVGNVFTTPLAEILAGAAAARFRRSTWKEECAECVDWAACRGGCRFRHAAPSEARDGPPAPRVRGGF